MKNDCAILVLSCDKYSNQLYLIKDSFNKNWENCEYKVYYGLEKKEMTIPGWNRLCSDVKSWAGRVKDYLQQIEENFVIIVLDDFYIEGKVSEKNVAEYVSMLINDSDIVNITFENIPDNNAIMEEGSHLLKRYKKGNYLVNMQIGVWNKEYLLHLLKDCENPWQTEIYGSVRARMYSDKKFYCIDDDLNMPIPNGRGWLIVRGCWNSKEIERLGLQNNSIILNDNKPHQSFDRSDVLVPRKDRIPEIVGVKLRRLLSLLHIYI